MTANSSRAVSPVVGIILMVAVVVILSATIGMFVLDLSGSEGQLDKTTAGVKVDEGEYGGTVTVISDSTHSGGSVQLKYEDGTTKNLTTGDTAYLPQDQRVVVYEVASGKRAVLTTWNPDGSGSASDLNKIYVDGDYTGISDGTPSHPYKTIQEGENAAVDGDSVVVRNSATPYSRVEVNTNITLIGKGAVISNTSDTTNEAIYLNDSDYPNVTITGFTLRGYKFGIEATGADTAWEVNNVTIVESSSIGIAAQTTSGPWVVRNTTIKRTKGIYLGRGSSDAFIKDVTFEKSPLAIGAYKTSGAWTVRNVSIHSTGNYAVYTEKSTGDWSVKQSMLANWSTTGLKGDSYSPANDGTYNWWDADNDGVADSPSSSGDVDVNPYRSEKPDAGDKSN